MLFRSHFAAPTRVISGRQLIASAGFEFAKEGAERVMLVTDQGKVIRTTVGDIRIASRNTQGVTIFNVADGEKVVSVAKIDESEEEEVELEGGDEKAPDTGATIGEDLASGDDA